MNGYFDSIWWSQFHSLLLPDAEFMFHAQVIKVFTFCIQWHSPMFSGPEKRHETERTKKGKTTAHFLQ